VLRRSPVPKCPKALAKAGAEEMKRAEAHFDAEPRNGKFDFRAYNSRPVRSALSKTFRGVCAYCEDRIDALEIEHYRPKGAVRTESDRLHDGYWWLASTWENLFPACPECNKVRWKETVDGRWVSSGKGEWFPLEDETARATAKGEESREKPLLLNPYEDEPSQHLEFLASGAVRARTRRGAETIRILDLNRSGLTRGRRAHLLLLEFALRDLESAEAELRAGKGDAELVRCAEEQVAVAIENGFYGATAQRIGAP
jgi:uncharacterized protein (TIGR02646 family)